MPLIIKKNVIFLAYFLSVILFNPDTVIPGGCYFPEFVELGTLARGVKMKTGRPRLETSSPGSPGKCSSLPSKHFYLKQND